MREPMQMPKAYVRKLSFLFWFLVFVLDFVNGPWWFFFLPRQLFLHLSSWWCSLLLVLGGYLYMGNKVGRSSVGFLLRRFLGSPQLRLPDFCYRWMGCCSLTESVPFHSLSGEDCGMMFFSKTNGHPKGGTLRASRLKGLVAGACFPGAWKQEIHGIVL